MENHTNAKSMIIFGIFLWFFFFFVIKEKSQKVLPPPNCLHIFLTILRDNVINYNETWKFEQFFSTVYLVVCIFYEKKKGVICN